MSSKSQQPQLRRTKSPLSKSTTQFFQSPSTIDQFITQFFLPKQHDYSQNILQFYSNTHNFIQKNHKIPNAEGQLLHSTVFYKSKLQKPPQNCIVYCHGFGSTRLQAVHILKVLKQQLALCCFDFSGSGKSQGSITTYGAKQKEDIHSVLAYLKQNLKFQHFVLWGRSMGATASLLYSMKYQKADEIQDQSVIFQVVDSPFVSFEKISLELAKKFISMPQFGTSIVLDMMKKHCNSLNEYNPFSVNLQNISQCKVPTLFIYSEHDDIVGCRNSEELCSKFTAFYEKMIITQNHNAPRSAQTLSEIIKKIQIQLKKCQISKSKGIVFRSFISSKSNKSKSNKKGIERSLRKETTSSSIFDFSKPSSVHRNAQYGLINGGKCQTPNPHSTKNFFKPLNDDITDQYFPNKPISFSTLPHQHDFKNYQSPFINTPQQTPRTHQMENMGQSPQQNRAQNDVRKSPYIHQINSISKNNQIQPQPMQNVYQMRKPQVLKNKNGKQAKRYSSPLISPKMGNPLTNFSRQQIQYENYKENDNYRDGQRRPSSTSRKLNISLSKLKNFKQKTFVSGHTQKYPIDSTTNNYNPKRQKTFQSSPYIATHIRSPIRPISPYTNIQPIKSSNQTTTPTTKAPSVSSSTENFHLLGTIKSPSKHLQSKGRSRNIFEDKNKVRQDEVRQGRVVKKVRSSEVVYYDKNLYTYGI